MKKMDDGWMDEWMDRKIFIGFQFLGLTTVVSSVDFDF
jgi:hypothetical protein